MAAEPCCSGLTKFGGIYGKSPAACVEKVSSVRNYLHVNKCIKKIERIVTTGHPFFAEGAACEKSQVPATDRQKI